MKKLNCWEFMKCGRQIGGDKVSEYGECPVSRNFKTHGLNGGINGGRSCWAIPNTLCQGVDQQDLKSRMRNCGSCDFLHLVIKEEGAGLIRIPVEVSDQVIFHGHRDNTEA